MASAKPHQPSPRPLLALETATTCGSVALVEGGKVLAEYSLDIPATHSRRLLAQIDQIRRDVGVDWQDLVGVAVSLGPGSFTGLRISLSMAKGLILAHNLPLLGVSTLDGLARQVTSPPGTKICALLDARKQEVYAALYECGADGQAERTAPPTWCSPRKNWPTNWKARSSWSATGPWPTGNYSRKSWAKTAIFAPTGSHFPRAATIGLLGEEKLARQELLDPVDSVPIYVRASEAEINLKKKA